MGDAGFHRHNGLLSFELTDADPAQLDDFIGALTLFGLGASWGGYESLITVADLKDRNNHADKSLNPVLRLHIGLEDVDALIEDLQKGFKAFVR